MGVDNSAIRLGVKKQVIEYEYPALILPKAIYDNIIEALKQNAKFKELLETGAKPYIYVGGYFLSLEPKKVKHYCKFGDVEIISDEPIYSKGDDND